MVPVDGVVQNIRWVCPNNQARLSDRCARTHFCCVQRTLCERDVVALGGNDRVYAAVAELDAAFAHRIIVVGGAPVIGAEEQCPQACTQLAEGLVVLPLVGGLQCRVRQTAGREICARTVAEHVHIVVQVRVQTHHVRFRACAAEIGGGNERLTNTHAAYEVVRATIVAVVQHAARADIGCEQTGGQSTEVKFRSCCVEFHAQDLHTAVRRR